MAATSPFPIPFPNIMNGNSGKAPYSLTTANVAVASSFSASPSSSSSNDSLSGSPPPSTAQQQQASGNFGGGTTRIKSSAAKRANAKAAAASKRAAAARDNNSSNRSTEAPSPTPGPDAKGDWIVPQRAKPGRKPSQEEPLTKRQAQNRASQRAFRERKQSHVQTLEAKVAAYEEEKLTRDAKEDKATRKLKASNLALAEENKVLKIKVKELELTLQEIKARADNAPGPSRLTNLSRPCQSSTCLEVGCRAPSHEGSLSQRLKRPLPLRSESSGQGGDHSNSLSHQPMSPSKSYLNTSRFGAMTIAAIAEPLGRPDLPHRPSQQTVSLWSAADMSVASPVEARITTARTLGQEKVHDSSPSLMEPSGMDMDRDCGFCTDSTPCVCRGEAILDLTGVGAGGDESSVSLPDRFDKSWLEGVDQMVKIEEEGDDDIGSFTLASFDRKVATASALVLSRQNGRENSLTSRAGPMTSLTSSAQDLPIRPAVSISSLLSSRSKVPGGRKLWNTTTTTAAATGLSNPPPPPAAEASASSETAKPSTARGSSKLWWTSPASAQTITTPSTTTFVRAAGGRSVGAARESLADALCSGDPSNCPACGTDPVLAAFCEAVADDGGAASEASSSFSSIGPSISISRRGSMTDRIAVHEEEDDAMMMMGRASRPMLINSALGYSGPAPSHSSPPYTTGMTATAPTPFSLPYRNASSTSVVPTLASLERHGYTIPDAFKQIRSHPAFPQWQGGLNLLADVVSGRAPPQQHQPQQMQPPTSLSQQSSPPPPKVAVVAGTSPTSNAPSPVYSNPRTGLIRRSTGNGTSLSMSEERKARHPSVEIRPLNSLQHRKTGMMESTDRDVMKDDDDVEVEGHHKTKKQDPAFPSSSSSSSSITTRPSLVRLSSLGRPPGMETVPLQHYRSEAGGSGGVGGGGGAVVSDHELQANGQGQGQHHAHKRRRLYVENDRVEEALRMLDCGVVGGPARPLLSGSVDGGNNAVSGGRITSRSLLSAAGAGGGGGGAAAAGKSSSSATGLVPCGECPCPCPWAQQAPP